MLINMEKVKQNIYNDLTGDSDLRLAEVLYLTVLYEPQVIVFDGCTAYTVRFICNKHRVSSVYWMDDASGEVVSASHIWMIGRGGKYDPMEK